MNKENKKPRYNAYVCEHGCIFYTVDVAVGVTPYITKCRRKSDDKRPLNPRLTDKFSECVGMATSSFYPTAPLPLGANVTHEWDKPTPEMLEQYFFDRDIDEEFRQATRDHVNRGGLLLFDRTDKEPVYHEPKTKN